MNRTESNSGVGRRDGDRLVRSFRGWRVLLVAVLSAAVLVVGPAPVGAATIIGVNTTIDVASNSDGLCSLREAIEAANTDTASGVVAGECPAGSGTDTISLQAGVVYLLGSALPEISSPMTVLGNGATIDADGETTVLVVQFATVVIDSIVLTGGGGSYGGGLAASQADVTVKNSTLAGNGAAFGGGLYVADGSLTLLNSTVAGNEVFGSGSGIYNAGANLTIAFSTVTANSSSQLGAAVYTDSGGLSTIEASIVAGNTGGGTDVGLEAGAISDLFVSGGFNIIGSIGTGVVAFAGATDLINQNPLLTLLSDHGGGTPTHAFLTGSPALDHVIGTVTNDQASDQRGVARPFGVAKDAGAYEFSGEAPLPCDSLAYAVSDQTSLNAAIVCFNTHPSGAHTIDVTADITLFGPSTTIQNPNFMVSLVLNGNGHTIDAGGNGSVFRVSAAAVMFDMLTLTGGNTLDGGGIQVTGAANVTVKNSTISGNTAQRGGGIFVSNGEVLMVNSTISGNTATLSGGGVHHQDGSLKTAFVTIANNTAPVGDGIASASDTFQSIVLQGTVITNNSGAGSDLELLPGSSSDPFSGHDNLAGSVGSGIYSGLTILSTDPLLGPLADNGGPTHTHALLIGSPAVDLLASPINDDQAFDQRGVARPVGSAKDAGSYELEVLCDGSTGSASGSGSLAAAIVCFNFQTAPGVYTIDVTSDILLDRTTPIISNSTAGVSLVMNGNGHTIDANPAGTSGRRLFTVTGSTVEFNSVMLTRGSVGGGGGGLQIANGSGSADVMVRDSLIFDNHSQSSGGVLLSSGTLRIVNTTITGNHGSFGAGGIENSGGTLIVSYSTITDNQTTYGAGGIETTGGSTTVSASLVAGNLNGPDVSLDGGVTDFFASGGFNVLGTVGPNINAFTGASDLTDRAALVGPLADNGGPTMTQALWPDSPAVDHVTDVVADDQASDQRGIARPQGAAKDAGAFELVPGSTASGLVVLATPCVVYDSTTAAAGLAGTFVGGESRAVQVTGLLAGQGGAAGCVPAGSTSVIVSVSAINPQRGGNLRLSAAGVVPSGGVVNFAANGLNNANTVTVPLSVGGAVAVAANGAAGLVSTDVRLAVIGFTGPTLSASLTYHPITPCVVADSRGSQGAGGAFAGPFAPGGFYRGVDVVGTFDGAQGGGNTTCGIPTNASSVVVNAVATNVTGGSGFLAVGSGGAVPPSEATTPFAAIGMNNAALAVAPLNGGETLKVSVSGTSGSPTTNIRLVALGYYTADATGLSYTAVNSCAIFDTRTGQGASGGFLGLRDGGSTTTYQVAGNSVPSGQGGGYGGDCGVPTGASAVLINLVGVNAAGAGNLRAYATGTAPSGGVLNFKNLTPSMNNSNAVIVPLSALGQLNIDVNTGGTNVVGAVNLRGVVLGYYN